MRKSGIYFCPTADMTADEHAKLIQEAGFSSVFTGMGDVVNPLETAEIFAQHGLEYETIHARFNRINHIWFDTEEGEDVEREFLQCVDICAQIGVPILVLHLSSGEAAPQITDIGRSRFDRIIERACQKNVKTAFENQRKLANLSWVLEYYGTDKNVGFCWDCGHEGCFTPGREYMPLFGDRLMCLHIHDNHCVYNEDEHLLPFDGTYPFENFARHIKKSGFQGTLMLETSKGNSPIYADMSYQAYYQKAYQTTKRLEEMIEAVQ